MRKSNGRIRRRIFKNAFLFVAVASCAALLVVRAEEPERARSIILMIGDGMGAAQIEAARWWQVGPDGALTMDTLSVQDGWSRTDALFGQTTDSAAAVTAMATGQKTANGYLSVDAEGQPLTTILEMAQAAGKAVGLVTSVPLAHATPAGFAAHNRNRNQYMPIAEDMYEAGVDVLLGGGAGHFLPYQTTCSCGWSGLRTDGRDLVVEAESIGYVFACDTQGLEEIDTSSVNRLLGLFANEEMSRPLRPSLAEMTRVAIEILSRDPDGFFLMVEGGLIDWVCHSNEAEESIELTLGFDAAVGEALEYVRDTGDTLLIVTADHETGGMSVTTESSHYLREDGPFQAPDGRLFFVNWLHTYHTDADVPVRAEGPFAALLSGTYENTHIFDVMVEAYGFETPDAETTGD
jgi:alkaline phosphatase